MLDDAVVVLEKAELVQRDVERPARGDEEHRHVQPCLPALRRVASRHPSRPFAAPSTPQAIWLSPSRLMRTSRWMPTFINRPKPNITVTIAVPP